ncbi:iron-containing alcohol dehydrogenase [Actinophytocola oryzae]|uniref:2-epi-5-epi-valiolone synthase n=1 Tax=Actinophytocola oryzae TaxID=502181 RepID=A0A4R7W2D3_9PSEU|nr:iron-containing alcohol dehydrogenase [Actinophytocola oryzae]TDV56039.1 3-dehydroquinate synthase [Actinophytocola oryzae]
MHPIESQPAEAGSPAHHWRVQAQLSVDYEVEMTSGVLDPSNLALLDAGTTVRGDRRRRFVVVDAAVYDIYGDNVRKYLEHHNVEHRLCVLPASEEAKTMESVFTVVNGLDSFGIARRHEPIIAIGGGIVLDIVGLVGSLYRRSTPYVRVPTSLIGLIDAGVGIKTGVNHGSHKNRLGSYFAPTVALLDRDFLATLDDRHISNGLAEILKIALIKDAELFQLLEEHAELLLAERLTGHTQTGDLVARDVFSRAVGGMLAELAPNLWEKQLERVVDYGHSFSPTLEMRALPELLHGEAVAVDMALTTVLAEGRGLVSTQDRERVFRLMGRLRLPVWHPLLDAELLEHALQETVRHRDGWQRMPIPLGIGAACFLNDLTAAELGLAAEILRELGERTEPGTTAAELVVTDVARRSTAAGNRMIRRSSLPPGGSREEETRTGTNFHFVLAGHGELRVDDVSHDLRPGYLVATGAGAVHRFANQGTEDLSWLVIEVSGTDEASVSATGGAA